VKCTGKGAQLVVGKSSAAAGSGDAATHGGSAGEKYLSSAVSPPATGHICPLHTLLI